MDVGVTGFAGGHADVGNAVPDVAEGAVGSAGARFFTEGKKPGNEQGEKDGGRKSGGFHGNWSGEPQNGALSGACLASKNAKLVSDLLVWR